jgi:hypothetical protein
VTEGGERCEVFGFSVGEAQLALLYLQENSTREALTVHHPSF